MARLLEFLECPQYLRKLLFPLSSTFQHAGLMNPLGQFSIYAKVYAAANEVCNRIIIETGESPFGKQVAHKFYLLIFLNNPTELGKFSLSMCENFHLVQHSLTIYLQTWVYDTSDFLAKLVYVVDSYSRSYHLPSMSTQFIRD